MKTKILYTFILLFASCLVQAATLPDVTRKELGAMLSRTVASEISGGVVKIQAIKASKGRVQIYTSIGCSYYPFREENTRAIYDSVRRILPSEYRKARIEIYTDHHEISELIPMACRTTRPKKKQDRPIPFVYRPSLPLVTPLSAAMESPTAGLFGRHIALWQSHGRFFDQERNCWRWQRSRLWETCEDLYTQSYVLPYLVPMLEHAGANVLLPRERDCQKWEILADNDQEHTYREEGSWNSGGVGFAALRSVYRSGENPFKEGTTRRIQSVRSKQATGRAVWQTDIPEAGEYAVYVSYEQTPNSVEDARYTVHHAGGESLFAVNQTMGGGTWIYLGTFRFEAGLQETVSLSNQSRAAGRIVSADAVKIGGGYGNIARTVDPSLRREGVEYAEETSGYPRFCEGSRYWLQWAGFDESVYAAKEHLDDYKEDYMSRAHWVNALMGGSERLPDSVGLRVPIDMALAFHSDAGVRDGDEVIGTLGIFRTSDNKGLFVGGASRYRSRDLTDLVMTQIVGDIRRTFEPEWKRRGLWNRAYYEARVPSAPTMLLELLSHQNFADMRYGNDPRFKFTVSRAIYKGILRYLASQYGQSYVVQPLPVQAFSVERAGANRVHLRWTPTVDSLEQTAVPTGYVVYTRRGTAGFDNGRRVDRPEWEGEQEPGVLYSYRITAINDGGESFPSETLSACCMPDDRPCVLVVNGFDRVCAPYSERLDSLGGFYHEQDGGVPDRRDISFVGEQRVFDLSLARCDDDAKALGACSSDYETEIICGNTFDYPALHGEAIRHAGYSFCSASAAAVERGEVSLTDYPAVDWIAGKQRSTVVARGVRGVEFRTFTPQIQNLLRQYVAHGGGLFVSGCYVASDLWSGVDSTEEDRAFAREVLHVGSSEQKVGRGGRVCVVATPQTPLSRIEYRFHTKASADHYGVEDPDGFIPMGVGAVSQMRYVTDGGSAAVSWVGDGRTFTMGFPFESVEDDVHRNKLMNDILQYLINR